MRWRQCTRLARWLHPLTPLTPPPPHRPPLATVNVIFADMFAVLPNITRPEFEFLARDFRKRAASFAPINAWTPSVVHAQRLEFEVCLSCPHTQGRALLAVSRVRVVCIDVAPVRQAEVIAAYGLDNTSQITNGDGTIAGVRPEYYPGTLPAPARAARRGQFSLKVSHLCPCRSGYDRQVRGPGYARAAC